MLLIFLKEFNGLWPWPFVVEKLLIQLLRARCYKLEFLQRVTFLRIFHLLESCRTTGKISFSAIYSPFVCT